MRETEAVAPRAFVCRCSEVDEAAVIAAIEAGARTINDVKRQTRAGMGACQGIYCVSVVADRLHRQAGIALDAIAPMTARPPVRLLPLPALADLSDPEP
jgi:NAD(P)H-nitrite reductase large subunit